MTVQFTDGLCRIVRALTKRATDLEVFLSMAIHDNRLELEQAVHLGRRVRGIATDAVVLAHLIEIEVKQALSDPAREKPPCSPA